MKYICNALKQFVCATELHGPFRQQLLLRNLIARKSAFVHTADHKSELREYQYACAEYTIRQLRRGFCLSRFSANKRNVTRRRFVDINDTTHLFGIHSANGFILFYIYLYMHFIYFMSLISFRFADGTSPRTHR